MNTHAALLVMIMAAVTALLRFLPFLLFRKAIPPFIAYLGDVLPTAVIGMLVVYCLKNINVAEAPFGIPELAAGLVTAGLHVWRRSTLISILGGTAVYMVLIQAVF